MREPEDGARHEIRELFVGHKTILSLMGVTIGGILVGRTLWEYGRIYMGLPATLLIGLVILMVSAIVTREINK